jgi:lipopolysaccharide transport system ATP-binding protein
MSSSYRDLYAVAGGGPEIGKSTDDVAIRASNLSKCYQIYDTPRDRLKQFVMPRVRRIVGKAQAQYFREFWALKDASFDVQKGESFGIIGRNGSGKSTLLQIICGTLSPTSGFVQTTGRVAALLELGAGFNPEFTGRENTVMNASLLGYSRTQIEEQFDNIAAFADIGEVMNQPVKTYSSGMYVRLAFAVAIAVRPDILIVDEALSVGDMAFQAKCMTRIRKMIEAGTTILFVSHDIGAVKALCTRCLYLERGRTVSYGRAADVAGLYLSQTHMEINAALDAPSPLTDVETITTTENGIALNTHRLSVERRTFAVSTNIAMDLNQEATRYGDGRVTVLDVKLLGRADHATEELEVDEPFQIQISVRANADIPDIAWGYSMRDLKGQMLIAMMSTHGPSTGPRAVKAGNVLILNIKGKNPLQAGIYTLAVGIELPVVKNQQHIFLEVVENALVFKSVWPDDKSRLSPGIVKVPVEFEMLACIGQIESTRKTP